jgi:hypothetical protein
MDTFIFLCFFVSCSSWICVLAFDLKKIGKLKNNYLKKNWYRVFNAGAVHAAWKLLQEANASFNLGMHPRNKWLLFSEKMDHSNS